MTLISSQTASGSASIEFTSGIDSSYPIYRFEFINIYSGTGRPLQFQASTNGGSSYGVTVTNTNFSTIHFENDSSPSLAYQASQDQAQSTSNISLHRNLGDDADHNGVGTLFIYNPSSTTFVKHYIGTLNTSGASDFSANDFVAGYFNTTSAVDAFKFLPDSGTISGTIKLYGIGD
jgi:hypothetical protein